MRALDESLPLKLLRAREAVMDRFRPHLHANGFTEQQWRVIRALIEVETIDAGALAEAVCLRMPSLSRILADLEARGLLRKIRSDADRRLVNVEITGDGRALFTRMSADSERIYQEIQDRLGDTDYKALMRKLDKVITSLNGA